ncbi:hypothetical protein GCM10027413_03740 [Conyzicola nivalis]|uniref:Secreted protein n=1 Tax=Conyzicola nivalis TaxID=1477021 RepID=A0A916WJN9_9MICO|nr:hypothetical protein [Conyzicola nivalis]GGB07798.1 hypothetical protein GCM10010979_22900 [Conyzicola nivalis]
MKTTTRSPLTEKARARRSWLVTLLATPALVIALAGCASASPDAADQGQGNGSGGAAQQPTTNAEFEAARDAYDLKLAQCLRDQGLDVKDPLPGVGISEDSPEIREAFPTCSAEIGDPPSSAGIQATPEDLEKALAQAECLREMGYEIQEPTADDIGFIPAEVTNEDFETCRTS